MECRVYSVSHKFFRELDSISRLLVTSPSDWVWSIVFRHQFASPALWKSKVLGE